MRYIKAICLGVIILCAAAGAFAADKGEAHAYLTEKFFVDVGIYFPERQLRISVDGTNPAGNDDIDFDDELNLKKSDQTGALNIGWRMGEHWKLAAQYFQSADNLTATLEEEIEWEDDVFPIGASVIGGQEFTLVRTLIGYEWNTREKQAIGFGGGLHWLKIGMFIEGELMLGGPGGPSVTDRRAVDAAGVLPNIGAWYRYSVNEKWVLTARYDWLSVAIGDYDGRLVNASIGTNYQIFDHFGVGVNYNFFELDVGVRKEDWTGKAITSYDGFYVYISAFW